MAAVVGEGSGGKAVKGVRARGRAKRRGSL
jgi:hypothetical protein